MTTAVQRRRGTNTEHASFTGLEGELSVNTTNESVHVHDGSTAGGFELARADASNIVATSIDINGGTIDGTAIGASSASTGAFTTLTASGSVGIGTSSPTAPLHVSGSTSTVPIKIDNTGTGGDTWRIWSTNDAASDGGGKLGFYNEDTATRAMTLDSSGNVGIGTSSPTAKVTVSGTGVGAAIDWTNTTASTGRSYRWVSLNNGTGFAIEDLTAGTERMRIDSSGNLLVGKTSAAGQSTAGIEARGDGVLIATKAGTVQYLNRTGSDGTILNFAKDGSTVGTIGSYSSSYLYIGSTGGVDTHIGFVNGHVRPATATGAPLDNSLDLGHSVARWDDIYATNGTIQTSDRNEKQDIAELSDAEQRVAVACKGLLRKFRWKDSVAEKGDDARIHFGIIAQDLQAAFEAEGLDAGDYAMFISTTWTDEETNEEKTRMGVRYSELLAFIISAI